MNQAAGERSKCKKKANAKKFGGTKLCEAEEVRQHFISPKLENEVFGYLEIKLFVVWISESFYSLLVKTYSQK